jgi:hypothetical protein
VTSIQPSPRLLAACIFGPLAAGAVICAPFLLGADRTVKVLLLSAFCWLLVYCLRQLKFSGEVDEPRIVPGESQVERARRIEALMCGGMGRTRRGGSR